MSEKPSQFPSLFGAAAARQETRWRPPVDVYRTPCGWLLKLELAGVRMEDISVQLQGNRLTVSGIRRDWALEEGCSHYMMEISYNRFERTIELPCDLAQTRLELEYREGILLIRVTA
ncbi:MAG: Hsp20/alpha crystallin family protein [Acidobacteriota bacterium]